MTKIKWILPIFLLCFTGCYNYRELTQLALTSAIGIEKAEDGYEITVQIVNTQKEGTGGQASSDQPKFVIYKHNGKTIQEALRQMIFESPRRLYLNHLNLLVIGEDLAKDGIHEILDFFARNTELRKQFIVVINKNGEMGDALDILTPLEALNAKNIEDSIITDSKYYGMSSKVTYEEVLRNYLNEKQEMVLPTIQVIGNDKKGSKDDNIKTSNPDASIVLKPLAIFDEDKLLGYLSRDQSRVYNFIRGKLSVTIVTFPCSEQEYFSTEIVNSKTTITPDTKKPKITIDLKGTGNIKEINCPMDLTQPSTIDNLQNMINQEMKQIFLKGIDDTIQEYHSDIYGFQDMIYKSSPTYYYKLKNQYGEDLLEALEIEVNVDIQLTAKGNIVRVIEP